VLVAINQNAKHVVRHGGPIVLVLVLEFGAERSDGVLESWSAEVRLKLRITFLILGDLVLIFPFVFHPLPFRKHPLVQHTGDENATGFLPVEDNMSAYS